jgi:hypothetical protein
MKPRLALACILIVFVALGLLIAFKTPAYESADEPGHVQNIETLVGGHWYGMSSSCRTQPDVALLLNCSGDEAQQAPLYYLLMAGWQRAAHIPQPPLFRGRINPANYVQPKTATFINVTPSDSRFVRWLRIPNVLLGALTVLISYFAIRTISSDPWTPVVGAAIIACWPRFVFLSAFVTNDNLVGLMGAILVYLALRYAKAPTAWKMGCIGAVFGLLVTTKLSTLPLGLVVVALACLVSGWIRRVRFAVIGLGSALLVSGWYLIQNTVRYGGPLARVATARYLTKIGGVGSIFGPYRVSDPLELVFVQVPQRIVDSTWYQSGWNQFHWSEPVNLVITAAFAGALLGLIGRRVDSRILGILGGISLVSLLAVWMVAFQTGTYQARYAFVGLVAIAGLAALGLERWKVPVRFLLPVAGLIGTVVAIQGDVLAVHWS